MIFTISATFAVISIKQMLEASVWKIVKIRIIRKLSVVYPLLVKLISYMLPI